MLRDVTRNTLSIAQEEQWVVRVVGKINRPNTLIVAKAFDRLV